MASRYLLANNDSAETTTVKPKHCGEIRSLIELTSNITLFITDIVNIYKVFAINN